MERPQRGGRRKEDKRELADGAAAGGRGSGQKEERRVLLWRAAAEGAGDRAALVEQGGTSPQAGVEAESAENGLAWRRTWRRYESGLDEFCRRPFEAESVLIR